MTPAGWHINTSTISDAALTLFLPEKDSPPVKEREISLWKLIHLLMICYGTRQEEEEKVLGKLLSSLKKCPRHSFDFIITIELPYYYTFVPLILKIAAPCLNKGSWNRWKPTNLTLLLLSSVVRLMTSVIYLKVGWTPKWRLVAHAPIALLQQQKKLPTRI